MKYLFLTAIALILLSCKTYNEENISGFDKKIEAYIKAHNLTYKKSEAGLYYNIINEGEGKHHIKLNDRITFYYEGYFLDGTEFQSIREKDAVTFNVKELIMGWQDALRLIKPGGSIDIIVPPNLGYGDNKIELIPANSILKYKLTVTEVI